MRVCRLSPYVVAAVLALPCLARAAAPAPAIAGPTLKQAVEAAWQRAPAVRTLQARRSEAAAAQVDAASWLAAPPTLGLSRRVDEGASARGQRESDLSVSAPVWLPGQKSARQDLAAHSREEVAAHLGATRLEVAALVRSRVWEAAAAQAQLDERKGHLHHLEELAHEVQRRVDAGDLARSDSLLAQQEVLATQIDVTQASTVLAEALGRYRALTGLSDLPAFEPEPLAEATAPAHDARVAAAQATEQRALAALRVASATRVGPPTIGVAVRREEERMPRQSINSIGLALQIPLGIGGRNRTSEAQARTAIATAAAEAAGVRASTEADIATARQRLANVRAALEFARARAKLLHEHTALFEKAFRAGERGLGDLLRSHALAHDAAMALAQQQVALGSAHAQLNQAMGVLP